MKLKDVSIALSLKEWKVVSTCLRHAANDWLDPTIHKLADEIEADMSEAQKLKDKMTAKDLEKAFNMLKANKVPGPYTTFGMATVDLAIDMAVNPPVVVRDMPQSMCIPATKKEETKMQNVFENDRYSENEDVRTTDQKQRAFLIDETDNISRQAKSKALSKFGLVDDDSPSTPKAFFERLASGKYTFPEDKMDKGGFWPSDVVRYIKWRDPAVKEDVAGYNAFTEELDKARRQTVREITVKDPETGLAKLVEFEQKYVQ